MFRGVEELDRGVPGIDIGEDRAEAGHRRPDRPVRARDREVGYSDVAALRHEQPHGAEGRERPAVIRAEDVGELVQSRGRPDGALPEAAPRRLEDDATVLEAGKGRYSRRTIYGAAAVPVDLSPSTWQRAGCVAIVGAAESRPKVIDLTLDVRGIRAYVDENLQRASRVRPGQANGREREAAAQ